MFRLLLLLLAGLAIAVGCEAAIHANAPAFSLDLPIACPAGQNCFVLLYPDRDPGPAEIDVGCGRMTYNDHEGTDFAISDERVMATGVPVQAAAAGTVLRVRDGVPDRRVDTAEQEAAVSDRECGNGVVIDHGNGWETQYCHLREGSVAVAPGDRVTPETTLGMVGASGLASFPHVHLTVRYQGEVIDPFVGVDAGPGCQVQPQPLWAEPLPYVPTGLIRAGFAPQPPDLDALWSGEFSDAEMPSDAPALVFWVHAYGVLEGDREVIQLIDPSGTVVADQETTLSEPNRIWLSYAGQRGTTGSFAPGTWQGRYQLMRGDRTLIDVQKPLTIE